MGHERLTIIKFCTSWRPAITLDEAVLSLGAEITVDSEESVGGSKQVKRSQKRTSPHANFVSKCSFASPLCARMASKGVARHPQTQDAQQQRTGMIRFLHLASLDC